jgi:hypothetical protein
MMIQRQGQSASQTREAQATQELLTAWETEKHAQSQSARDRAAKAVSSALAILEAIEQEIA